MSDLRRWADRLHPDDREAVLGELPRVFRGERLVAEYRIRRGTDGAERWIRDVGFPIRDADGRVRASRAWPRTSRSSAKRSGASACWRTN